MNQILWCCMMTSEVCIFTHCSSWMVHLFSFSKFPPSSPLLSSSFCAFYPSSPCLLHFLSLSPPSLTVSCPRWQRGAVPLSGLCAAGAVNFRLVCVMCCIFSANTEDPLPNENGGMFYSFPQMAELTHYGCENQSQLLLLPHSPFFPIWIHKHICVFRLEFNMHNTVLTQSSTSKK